MIQIANMVIRQGDKDPFVRNVYTLKSCARIVGAEVLSFEKEQSMLRVSVGNSPLVHVFIIPMWSVHRRVAANKTQHLKEYLRTRVSEAGIGLVIG